VKPASFLARNGHTHVLNPNGISIGSAVFAGFTSVTNRPTDHASPSVTIGRIYVRSTAMRSKNILMNYNRRQTL